LGGGRNTIEILSPSLENFTDVFGSENFQCGIYNQVVDCWGKHNLDILSNNAYKDYVAVVSDGKLEAITRNYPDDNYDISKIEMYFFPYVFKNELRFFYQFDKALGEKIFDILGFHSQYIKLFSLFHSEIKKEFGLIDTDNSYRFLWNKYIFLPLNHEFVNPKLKSPHKEDKIMLKQVLIESIKTVIPLMTEDNKQLAQELILKLTKKLRKKTLKAVEKFVLNAGINPYIRPRVKLQMELIRLLGL